MTPKEKAEELIEKFSNAVLMDDYEAKQCALIAVNQMISMLPFTDLNTYIGKWCEQQRQYLEEVKQEIESI